MADDALRIYIHIPFCVRKCAYCDFLSFPSDDETKKRYVKAVKKEIAGRLPAGRNRTVSSVFLGGGTPSILPADAIADILETVHRFANVARDAEITIEANPCTLTQEKLRVYREAGVNRLSIGAQSLNDSMLKILGRLHNRADVYRAYEAARTAGFDNINLDFIFGLPGQTAAEFEREIREAASVGSEHLSIYALQLEKGTPLYESADAFEWPDEESLRAMYETTETVLGEAGYRRYEISNYAKSGRECRHNTGYWTGDEYLGAGLGASSFIGGTRFRNTRDFGIYLAAAEGEEALRNVRDPDRNLSMKEGTGERSTLDPDRNLSEKEGTGERSTLDPERNPLMKEGIGEGNTCVPSRSVSTEKSEEGQNTRGNNRFFPLPAVDGKLNNRSKVPRSGNRSLPKTEADRWKSLRRDVRVLPKEERMSEFMILGLRMTEGVSPDVFRERFGEELSDVFAEPLRKYLRSGFMTEKNGRIALAQHALFVSNTILADFLL